MSSPHGMHINQAIVVRIISGNLAHMEVWSNRVWIAHRYGQFLRGWGFIRYNSTKVSGNSRANALEYCTKTSCRKIIDDNLQMYS